jgi:hypothetical protein
LLNDLTIRFITPLRSESGANLVRTGNPNNYQFCNFENPASG